jgi:adenine-specific DNA-methyltransferase
VTEGTGPHRFSARGNKQRRLGIYYTPQWLARLIVDWALQNIPGSLLDPSFGGCAFLVAAREALAELGARNAQQLIFGFDVDRRARRFVAPLLEWGVPQRNIIFGDFLTEEAQGQFGCFQAVVGNPPYVRHHTMTDDAVIRAQKLIARAGASLPRTAGAWAYFSILSAAYVATNGRLALVLPGATLQSNYGASVISFMERSFQAVRVLHVHDRLFEDTDEESVVLLASGRGGECDVRYQRVESIAKLKQAIFDGCFDRELKGIPSYRATLIPDAALAVWHDAIANPRLAKLKEVADTRIGVVTGANDFFLRQVHDDVCALESVRSVPIVASKRWLSRPYFDLQQLRALDKRGLNTRLVILGGQALKSSRLRDEIAEAERSGISRGHHCRKRDPWYTVTDTNVPDLFLPYMSGGSPFAVVNYTNATCTNSLHRLTLRPGFLRSATSIAASTLSSLFHFESELRGRYYGGGVLKLEPREAGALHVAKAALSERFDAIYRNSGFHLAGAREYIDEHFLRNQLRMSRAAILELRRATAMLSRERMGSRSPT